MFNITRAEQPAPISNFMALKHVFHIFSNHIYVYVCVYVHASAGTCAGQKRAEDPLGLGL